MRTLVLLGTLLIFMATPVLASPTVTVTQKDGYWDGSGGEFTVTPSAELIPYMAYYDAKALVDDGFQTFCLEGGEVVTVDGTTVYSVTLNDKAIDGGVGPQGDPLSVGAAWLYHEFQLGRLDNYDYTPGDGRKASAENLQLAIWWLEGEGNDPGTGNVFRTAVVSEFGNVAGAMADNKGLIPVAVLNMSYPDGEQAQDFLICIPAPGAILLGSIGAGLVGWLRRRRMV